MGIGNGSKVMDIVLKRRVLRFAVMLSIVMTVIFFYCSVATGELWGLNCKGHYSLFHENPDCRTPVLFGIGFYVSFGMTLIFVLKAVLSGRTLHSRR